MPRIILILLDACRYDHLGCYGYPKNTTPNIDRLASNSTKYINAYSCDSHTTTSLPTIFSGDPNAPRIGPQTHSVGHGLVKHGSKRRPIIPQGLSRLLPKRSTTTILETSLIPKFQRHMTTCCVSANPYLYYGFRQGFDKFYSLWDGGSDGNGNGTGVVDPASVTEKALAFLDQTRGDLLLYCHYMQPHYPYSAPFAGRKYSVKELKNLENRWWDGDRLPEDELTKIVEAYDDNLRWVDREIEPLLRVADGNGSVMVITSDHGEEFGEQGGIFHRRHRQTESATHVPLIIHGTGQGEVKKRITLDRLLPLLRTIIDLPCQ